MPYSIPIKYFNSFWIKKVVGDTAQDQPDPALNDYQSTVTTSVSGYAPGHDPYGDADSHYLLPTWPGLPWGHEIETIADSGDVKGYPCFPWGGRDWNSYSGTGNLPDCGTFGVGGGSLTNTNPSPEEGRERNWFIEEARIRGGYNNTSVDFGVKAYVVEEFPEQQDKFNSMTYSGIYNSRTGINQTNVFSTAEDITKSVDPAYGSIQKLYAKDTNLIIFQENKVSRALIDKDAVYTAEGSPMQTQSNVVIGAVQAYAGQYGISTNPESFAKYGIREYFADKSRGTIMRLSHNGLTEVSSYGMKDYFRDTLSLIKDGQLHYSATYIPFFDLNPCQGVQTFELDPGGCPCDTIEPGMLLSMNGNVSNIWVSRVDCDLMQVTMNTVFYGIDFGIVGCLTSDWPDSIEFVSYKGDTILGAFDTHNKNYTVSLQWNTFSNGSCVCEDVDEEIICEPPYTTHYSTVGYDEDINGWVSFYTYMPTAMDSLKNDFYSVNGYTLYRHYNESAGGGRGEFYNVINPASIEFIFNDQPSLSKNFQTINYEGSSGWYVERMNSDLTEPIKYPSPENWSIGDWYAVGDQTSRINSYVEGRYIDSLSEQVMYSGFNRRENKYVATIINNTASPFSGEVQFTETSSWPYGNVMSGIKGYYATIKLTTDQDTQLGFMKELFAVTTTYAPSSY